MSDHDAVLQANRTFYDAFESLDVEKMERVWLQASHIVCIHPGWRKLKGWGPIMNSWSRIFESTFEMKFDLEESEVVVRGDIAVVVVEENIAQRGYDGPMKSRILATNIFERVGAQWRMILHHGSPVAMAAGDEPLMQ